jgi:chromosome segregation ATPase
MSLEELKTKAKALIRDAHAKQTEDGNRPHIQEILKGIRFELETAYMEEVDPTAFAKHDELQRERETLQKETNELYKRIHLMEKQMQALDKERSSEFSRAWRKREAIIRIIDKEVQEEEEEKKPAKKMKPST